MKSLAGGDREVEGAIYTRASCPVRGRRMRRAGKKTELGAERERERDGVG